MSAPRCVGVALIVAISCGTALASGYRRGDADCNLEVSVADIVAVMRGLSGHSVCDNDDCDRDGEVTAADVECTASCLFGQCTSPPIAPRPAQVIPDTAPGVGRWQ